MSAGYQLGPDRRRRLLVHRQRRHRVLRQPSHPFGHPLCLQTQKVKNNGPIFLFLSGVSWQERLTVICNKIKICYNRFPVEGKYFMRQRKITAC